MLSSVASKHWSEMLSSVESRHWSEILSSVDSKHWMVQFNNSIFWDNDKYDLLCVKFQPCMLNVTKVMNPRGMAGQTGLEW